LGHEREVAKIYIDNNRLENITSFGIIVVKIYSGITERRTIVKLVIAIVQSDKLKEVKKALSDVKVGKITVSNVIGCGAQVGKTETCNGAVTEGTLLDRVRFEIAVNDEYVKPTLEAIIKGARTGNIGDGKIFIVPLEECIRVRTGESGRKAIG
jgi:nitrogen regulatory protein P-II 2